MAAETEVLQLQAEKHQGLQATTGKASGGFFPGALRDMVLLVPDLRLLVSKKCKNNLLSSENA